MNLTSTLSERFVPILTLLMLSTPLSYIGAIFHEEGHGLLALVQGGTFTGIVIGQGGSYALANSYLMSIGGWIGQYVLLITVLTLAWRLKPKSFLARSAVAILVLHETIDQPGYIASIQGDSAAAMRLLEATGIGEAASVATMEAVASVLLVVGGYISWRVLRTYFSQVFPWIGKRRSSQASFLFVILSVTDVLAGNTPMGESLIVSNVTNQFLIFIGLLLFLSLVAIPPAPQSWQKPVDRGTHYPAFAFALLLIIEAELVYFFVLPITIPFP